MKIPRDITGMHLAKKLTQIKATPKNGDEKLSYEGKESDNSLLDFWKWSVSDILSNATRGRFAEFVVGTAIDLNPEDLRDEWDAYDLTSKDGIKIEVKSAAYIQSWNQNDYSKISFSIRKARFWDAQTNMRQAEARRHADIYVFCLLNHKDQATIDPLKLEQWEFYVMPTFELDNYRRSQSSITLKSLRNICEVSHYSELKEIIEISYKKQIKFYPQ